MYKKEIEFDKNNKARIYQLIMLKGHCLFAGDMLDLDLGAKVEPKLGHTFFSDMSGAVDVLLYFFMNDEVTNCLPERGPLQELFAELKTEHFKEEDERLFRMAMDDIKDMYGNRVEYMIGSSFLDFTVSSYSVFEFWMGRLYESIKETDAKRREKKEAFVKEQIGEYNAKTEPERQQILKNIMEKSSPFMSGKGKVDYIFSKMPSDLDDLDFHKEVVEFYGALRNTVHNLGIHKGHRDYELSLGSGEVTLRIGESHRTSNWSTSIELCYKLVAIYVAAITSLGKVNEDLCVIYK
ncbi:hypothetical protein C1X59_13630 [Pseudomonas sp. FW215-R2]|uniref:hypothetical protein n=1 Tax=unclassified Pseudomonas TaxID=196821 RepID=UPI000C880BC1|nr:MULTISPECIES: hypothetical protein [unclassified Pseudomonas]PMX00614.1 hypothetical protein C1X59_13630 [Pseudomonas sp. FW215-R2]PMX06700.1 hypothetical protein C1X60_23480 [Pseudomonas sp. FW215-L1]PMX18874.1 hypothetical protein C1X57_26180 [Pseudomonas sp. FW215-E1]PNA23723.1 hypothetical protein C1X58_24985 [Pseudomonas sp. FW215-R4]